MLDFKFEKRTNKLTVGEKRKTTNGTKQLKININKLKLENQQLCFRKTEIKQTKVQKLNSETLKIKVENKSNKFD